MMRILTTLLILCFTPTMAAADPPVEIHVAVASNFATPLREIARVYEAETGHSVVISPGSTGRHYAQITAGAPFDIFLAADVERPRLLVEKGLAVADSRFTYAVGQLVFYGRLTDDSGALRLTTLDFDHLAIANPRLAPYGRAAQQVLENLHLWDLVQDQLVLGQNVAQAFQFVHSRSADLGLVSRAQVHGPHGPLKTPGYEVSPVPTHLHDPIEQQAVLLTRAADNGAAIAFLDFLTGRDAQAFIQVFGYALPGEVDP